jgi:hypothetical protein
MPSLVLSATVLCEGLNHDFEYNFHISSNDDHFAKFCEKLLCSKDTHTSLKLLHESLGSADSLNSIFNPIFRAAADKFEWNDLFINIMDISIDNQPVIWDKDELSEIGEDRARTIRWYGDLDGDEIYFVD